MGLQILWFILWGLLWAVYFALDGFDFGSGMLFNFLARNDTERGQILASVGPVWNGNEVWLITAGGATFAAFPRTYANMFSFLYLPLLIILWSLILRGVSIEFRGKLENPKWRRVWEVVILIGSFVPALLFGVAFGNIFAGLKMNATGYHGTFFGLLNPYGVLTGLLFVALFLHHASLWIAMRTGDNVAGRAAALSKPLWTILLIVAVLFLAATAVFTHLYTNFLNGPWWFIVPLLAVAALLASRIFAARGRSLAAFLSSAATIILVVFTGIIGLYPNLIPSSIDPAQSLTIFNSSSSHLTLLVMTIVAVIFVPIVIIYQFFVYRLFHKPAGVESLEGELEGY